MEAGPGSDISQHATTIRAPDFKPGTPSKADTGMPGATPLSASVDDGGGEQQVALKEAMRQHDQEHKDLEELKEAMTTSDEQYETETFIAPVKMATHQIWNEADARQQAPTAPRSAFSNTPKKLLSAQDDRQPSDTDHVSWRGGPRSKDELVKEAKSAEERFLAAAPGSQARSRALDELQRAEDMLKELYPARKILSERVQASMPTKDLWAEEDPRLEAPTPPRSAYPRGAHGVSHQRDIHNNLSARDLSVQGQGSQEFGKTASDTASGAIPDDLQRKSQSGERTANGGHSRSFRGADLSSTRKDHPDDRDLEAGTTQKHFKKRRTDDHDIDGRKRVFGPKREERIVDPVPPKANYAPGEITPPEPTYLDRNGRTELEVFQALVGVHFLANAGAPIDNKAKQLQPASVMSDIFLPSRAAAYRHRNRGLYDRCISQDMKMRVMYSFSHYMISFLYLLQILVAATLTGLSSYTDTAGVALTVLGAINTVLAGILAWLNGQGMPVRYRRSRDQYREVVRAIEDAERMFSTIDYVEWPQGTRPTPVGERDKLFKMYEKARQDQEANYPDTHENADKSEVASHTKELEAKIEKHKKQKKAKAKELQAALDKLHAKTTQKSDASSESTAAEPKQESDHYSKAELDEYAHQLKLRRKEIDLAFARLAEEEQQKRRRFEYMEEEMRQRINNMLGQARGSASQEGL